MQEVIPSSLAIMLVIDSKDRQEFHIAAELLYEILNNFEVLDKGVPIMVVCNKQDVQFSRKAIQIESELEKEIEALRKVRRATIND